MILRIITLWDIVFVTAESHFKLFIYYQAGWKDQEFIPDGNVTVYTMYGPVSHKVSRTVCYSDKCRLYWSGQEQCIFRVTHATAAGYEIGWHFVDLVIRSKCSFKSFCDLMTATYLRANQSSRGFMDQKTFIQWWFSWASHQDIEFRQVCRAPDNMRI